MPTKITQKNTQKIPKLRFGGFVDAWEEKKLGDKNVSEINPNTGELPKKFVYIDLESVEGGILKQEKSIQKNNAPSRAQRLLEKNDILFQTVRPYQQNNLFFNKAGNYVASTGYAQIKAVENSQFLYQYVHTKKFLNKVLARCTGTSYPAINSNDLKVIKINIPKKEEQQKIAGFLGGVDEWVENLKNQKEKLEKYKKGMMQKIFSQEIRFKNEDGKNFPNWKKKKLGDIGKTYNGLTGKSGEDFGEGDGFITYKQIFDSSEIDIKKFAFVKISAKEKQNKSQFGDIFFTTSSETPLEVGFASVLLDKNSTPYLNSFSFGLRPGSLKKIDPYFAKFFFRNSLFRREVVKLAQGSTRYNISKIEFMKIKLQFPSLPEQQKIAEFLTSLDKGIESKQQQITQAKQWKKGLMQGLFV